MTSSRSINPQDWLAQIGQRISLTLRYVRLRSYDTSTEDGRSQERLRRIALSALASTLAKLVSVATALVSVPLTLSYLGPERYGLWMSISSVITMLGFADFGIGNGVLTLIATAKGRDDNSQIRRVISSATAMLLVIALLGFAAIACANQFINWTDLFKIKTEAAQKEVGPSITVFLTILAINVPLGLVGRIQAGLQESFRTSLWLCAGAISTLGGILVATHLKLSLPLLIVVMAGTPALFSLLNAIHFFGWTHRSLCPVPSQVSPIIVKAVGKAGILFFILQAVASITFTSDNFLISQALGAEAVTSYAVPEKLFYLIPALVGMVTQPLWPAYGEAIARGDIAWAKRVLKKSLLVTVAAAAFSSGILAIFGQDIIRAWTGNILEIPSSLLFAIAAWKIVEAAGVAISAYLNGSGVVGFQVVIGLTTFVVAMALKWFGLINFGLVALPLGMASAYILFALVPIYLFRSRYIKA